MGIGPSSQIQSLEQERWAKDHDDIMVDDVDNARFVGQVDLLEKNLQLCYCNKSLDGKMFRHYFITDQTRTIEFGSGDPLAKEIQVEIHSRKHTYASVRCMEKCVLMNKFVLDEQVKARIFTVLGMKNFSFALRNSEHVAYYIYCGAWASSQMLDGRNIHGILQITSRFHPPLDKHGMTQVNILPQQLFKLESRPKNIFPLQETFLELTNASKEKLDDESLNVLVIGPTGCGKSSIINNLFNSTVCQICNSVRSCAHEFQITEGTVLKAVDDVQTVNVVDTTGLCDSPLSDEVAQLMLNKFTWKFIRNQKVQLDVVIVVVSGRIESHHSESIKQILSWLNFEKYHKNFCFVYNKTDELCDITILDEHLIYMKSLFGVNTEKEYGIKVLGPDGQTRLISNVMGIGIPPWDATHEEVVNQLGDLCQIAFTRRQTRIPIEPSMCNIM